MWSDLTTCVYFYCILSCMSWSAADGGVLIELGEAMEATLEETSEALAAEHSRDNQLVNAQLKQFLLKREKLHIVRVSARACLPASRFLHKPPSHWRDKQWCDKRQIYLLMLNDSSFCTVWELSFVSPQILGLSQTRVYTITLSQCVLDCTYGLLNPTFPCTQRTLFSNQAKYNRVN